MHAFCMSANSKTSRPPTQTSAPVSITAENFLPQRLIVQNGRDRDIEIDRLGNDLVGVDRPGRISSTRSLFEHGPDRWQLLVGQPMAEQFTHRRGVSVYADLLGGKLGFRWSKALALRVVFGGLNLFAGLAGTPRVVADGEVPSR